MNRNILTHPRTDYVVECVEEFRKKMMLTNFPVNSRKLLRKKATFYKFDTTFRPDLAEVECFTLIDDLHDYSVFINTDIASGRDSWTYGHELGHIELGHLVEFNHSDTSSELHSVLECEADLFSGHLLVPTQELLRVVRSISGRNIKCVDVPDIGFLKDYFGVSWGAVMWRLHATGIQEQYESQYLFDTYYARKYGLEQYR